MGLLPGILYHMPPPPSFQEGELAGLRAAQELAYACAREIAGLMQEGWTERQVARLMDVWLRDHGVLSVFHKSFAWFGERTRFDGMRRWWDFLPTDRPLKAGEPVILDTAPVFRGYPADIGYPCSLGRHERLDQGRLFLKSLRGTVLELFNGGLSGAEVCEAAVRHIRKAGYEPVHHRYPGAVLGHRLHLLRESWRPSLPIPFGWHAVSKLLSRGVVPDLLNEEHQGKLLGGWAIEPHIGGAGFGCKFEEMLVVDERGARWLAGEVPW